MWVGFLWIFRLHPSVQPGKNPEGVSGSGEWSVYVPLQ